MWRLCGQFLEKIRERLFDAGRIFKFYARHFQSQNRKTHRHAMIIVSLDLCAVQFTGLGWINHQRVAFLDDFGTALGQLRPQRNDALAFLHAQPAEVSEF